MEKTGKTTKHLSVLLLTVVLREARRVNWLGGVRSQALPPDPRPGEHMIGL